MSELRRACAVQRSKLKIFLTWCVDAREELSVGVGAGICGEPEGAATERTGMRAGGSSRVWGG